MNYLYLRTDGADSLTAEQLSIVSAERVDRAYLEKRPGRRDTLRELTGTLSAGDRLIVESFSEAAESAAELLALLDTLAARQCALRSIREGFDTESEQGAAILSFCAALGQLDKKRRRERQRAGVEQAKTEGKYRGRKPIEVDDAQFDETVTRWRQGELTAKQAMKALGLKPNTFYRRVKEREEAQGHEHSKHDASDERDERDAHGANGERGEVGEAVAVEGSL